MDSAILLERFRGIGSEMKGGAFDLVDKEEVLAKAKRDRSSSFMSLVERKERTKEQRIATTKQVSLAAEATSFAYKQHIQASRVVIALSFNPNMPRAPHVALNLGPQRDFFGKQYNTGQNHRQRNDSAWKLVHERGFLPRRCARSPGAHSCCTAHGR
jgi:hypothetical protein